VRLLFLLAVFKNAVVATEPQAQKACIMPQVTKPPAGALNVLGRPLVSCSLDPVTGFQRSGVCQTGAEDTGSHVICAELTQSFLDFTVSRGNDLVTPKPEWNFPGLKAGDNWCLCASRWKEALLAGVAPAVHLDRSHEKALRFVTLKQLEAHAVKPLNP
jgi:uncharacterized protein